MTTDVTNNLPPDADTIGSVTAQATAEQKRAKAPTRPAILAADLIDEIAAEDDVFLDSTLEALQNPKHAADCRRLVEYLDRADKLPPKTRRLVVLALTDE